MMMAGQDADVTKEAAAVTVELSQQPDSGETVNGGVRALLEGIVDYAGLFPPAQLDMPTTVHNYARYLAGESAWMLGRLVIPVVRLDDFEQHAESSLPKQAEAEPWQVSALVADAGDPQLGADLQRIAAFNEVHADASAGLATIHVIELRADTPASIDDALNRIPDELFPFFELPTDADPRGLIAALAGSDAGAKVRTGGLKPQASPRPEDLALFIAACAAPRVPFKATAGLHHPLSQGCDEASWSELGFLNVFMAAALAVHKDLPQGDLTTVLADGSLDSFGFTDRNVRYREHELTNAQIEESRRTFAVSFGSCSFDEPWEGLRALCLV